MSSSPGVVEWKRGTGPFGQRGLLDFAYPWRRRRRGPGLAGVLWDMDGLLVDSEPLWTIAETELLARWGRRFTPEMKAAVVGTRMDSAVPALIGFGGPAAAEADPAAVADRLFARMAELYATRIPFRPGARELMDALAAEGVRQALVSSSYRVLVDAVLAGVPEHPFAVSVAGDEVAGGKPDPEPYLAAAERLGVPIAACVVLEDSPAGGRSGAAAGASVVYCPSVQAAPPADPGWRQVASLREVSVASLRARLA